MTTGTETPTRLAGRTRIEELLPAYDRTIVEAVVVDAPPAVAWEATRYLDLMRVKTPLLQAAMWVRDLPERAGALVGGRPRPEPPPRLTFDEGEGLEGWVGLGGAEGREVTFGAVGRFWTPRIEWIEVRAEEFAGFERPGLGKIVAGFSVVPFGEGRSIVTYEARTATFDPGSGRSFARYWTVVRPFVGHIMRAALATIRSDAERLAREPSTPEGPKRAVLGAG